MPIRFRSGVLSALIVLVGVAFLAGFVAAPPIAYALLWLAAELRALRHRRKRDFLAFELDPYDAARLESAREAAADIVQRLSDIEAGRIHEADPEVVERLLERYRSLRTRMAALREQPLRRLRKWSSARAAASACRIGLVCIPLLTAGTLAYLHAAGTAVDPLRILSAVAAGWTLCALPPLIWLRRRRIERALGDRDLFYERWRPDEDFLDFYLTYTEHDGRPEEAPAGEPPEEPAPHPPEPESAAAPSRPKRPWHEVLEVAPDADEAAIKRAYHQRLMEYHPDKVASLGAEIRALADVITREITTAYQEAGRGA
jgi:DnaJ-domain-containing protein 1